MNLSTFIDFDFETSLFVLIAFVTLTLFCTLKLPTFKRELSRMWRELIDAKKSFERKL